MIDPFTIQKCARPRRRAGHELLWIHRHRSLIMYLLVVLFLLAAALYGALCKPDNQARAWSYTSKPTVAVMAESWTSDDLQLAARVVWGEAHGEAYTGKVGVAEVIRNRVDSSGLSVHAVINTPAQFCIGGHWDDECMAAVDEAARGSWNVRDARWFFSNDPALIPASWMQNSTAPVDGVHLVPPEFADHQYVCTIDGHDFYAEPVVMVSRGSDRVVELQTALDTLGYDLGPCGVDGRMGPATRAAIRAFQADAGIAADGVVGPETLEELMEV